MGTELCAGGPCQALGPGDGLCRVDLLTAVVSSLRERLRYDMSILGVFLFQEIYFKIAKSGSRSSNTTNWKKVLVGVHAGARGPRWRGALLLRGVPFLKGGERRGKAAQWRAHTHAGPHLRGAARGQSGGWGFLHGQLRELWVGPSLRRSGCGACAPRRQLPSGL